MIPSSSSRPFVQAFAFLILAFAIVQPSLAGLETWTSAGPTTGIVADVAVDPTDASLVYAATSGGGVFYSADGGDTWTRRSEGLKSWFVMNLTVHPTLSGTLYAGTRRGVFKSTDSGLTWSEQNSGLDDLSLEIIALSLDPGDPSTLYVSSVGGNFRIFKSTDSAASWVEQDTGVPTTIKGLAVAPAVAPSTPRAIYASTSQGIYKSIDDAPNWTLQNSGLTSTAVTGIASDPAANLYIGTADGVFKSTDGAATWTAQNTGLSTANANAVTIDPVTAATLYVGTPDGIFKSVDGAANWSSQNTGLPSTNGGTVTVAPSAPATLYASTIDGIFKSTNSAASWNAPQNDGLVYSNVFSLAIDPTTPTTLYAGGGGVSKSTDGGLTWVSANTGLTNLFVRAVAIDPNAPSTVYAGTGGGVFKSTDGAQNWSEQNTGLTNLDVTTLAVDPITPTTLYVGNDDGIFKSTDGAASWTAANSGLASAGGFTEAFAIDPLTPSTLYVAQYESFDSESIFKSVDGGASWTPINSGLPGSTALTRSLVVDPSNPDILYLAKEETGIYKSVDGGLNWTSSNSGLHIFDTVLALAVDPLQPSTIYASVFNSPFAPFALSIFRSLDGAASWEELTAGMPVFEARTLVPDPATPGLLHAGTLGAGVQTIFLDDLFELTGSANDGDDVCDSEQGNILNINTPQAHRHLDQDWVHFDAVNGEVYRIETLNLSPTSDTKLSLFSECKTFLADNDDADPGTFRSQIEYSATESSRLNVQVQQASDGYDSGDSYQVKWSIITPRTLSMSINGGGSVTSTPAGIDCGSDCSEAYENGTVVALTATPDPDWAFSNWGGFADCIDGTVTMTFAFGCSANFVAGNALTVTKAGTGSGTVTSAPVGIDCGSECSYSFPTNTMVTLTATPEPGSLFAGWSGDADCSDGQVDVNANLNCQATFDIDASVIFLDGFESGGTSSWSSTVR